MLIPELNESYKGLVINNGKIKYNE